MQTRALRGAAKFVGPIGCATAAVLATSAGFAAIVEPSAASAHPQPGLPLQPAPALGTGSLAPSAFVKPSERSPGVAFRLPRREFDAERTAEPEPVAMIPAKPEPEPFTQGISGKSSAMIEIPSAAAPMLVEARGKTGATYSTAPQEISAGGEAPAVSTMQTEIRTSALAGDARTGGFRPPDIADAISPSPRDGIAAGPWARTGLSQHAAFHDAQDKRARVAIEVGAKINGAPAGQVLLQIRDNGNFSVRLADLLEMLHHTMEPEIYERLGGSQAGQSYVTLNDLRAAGIPVRFNDEDQLLIGH